MNKKRSNQSFGQHQNLKNANSEVEEPSCEGAEVQTELAFEESLNAEELSHVVGGANEESGHLESQTVLSPPSRNDSPFDPSPTYPPVPNAGIPPSHPPGE